MTEQSIVSIQELKQTQLLNNGLIMADKFINKNYLINIAEQQIVPISEDIKSNSIRLFQITKVVYDKKENVNDKLISVYSALQNIDSSAVVIIDGKGSEIAFYIGIVSSENAATASKILEKSFIGNFPGSSLNRLKNNEILKIMENIIQTDMVNTVKNISCVTVVPSMRDEDKDKFVQGMEKFIDTMQNEIFTAVFIAAPVSKENLEQRKRGLEELYSSLSPLIKTSLAYGENDSKAVSQGVFENFSKSVNNSISNTTGRNSGSNFSESKAKNRGGSFGSGPFGFNTSGSVSKTKGYSSGTSVSKSISEGTSDSKASGTNESESITTGTSKTITIEQQNKTVAVLLEKIDEQLKRMKACEAFGVWECAGYFIADDIQTSVVAANTYKALMLGDKSEVENSFINVWGIKTPENSERLLEYIKHGHHPIIEILPEDGYETQFVTPANYISGKELPLIIGLPQKSVSGLTVSSIAEFGRNVFIQSSQKEGKKIQLGKIHHMGKTEENAVHLDLDSFTSHCFITGSTGSGKSNTSYVLLESFIKEQIPFLVIEPAKGEYKEAFGSVEGINIFSTHPLIGQMLKINPFSFNENIHILEHLDRLIEIFNACWEMYAAMPAILKDACEKIYVEKGWDLLNSIYLKEGKPEFPTFNDLMRTLPAIINSSAYSSDTKGDYVGALVTRVNSLTNGISGQIFCDNYEIPDSILFDESTIIDLSRVGSSETKSLIMGLIVLKLSEYRMANASGANSKLKHITVLEEAHNLLKQTNNVSESSNVVKKSVEMICNNIAEMRTYGEGFIIIDQSPTAVDIAAIKNTNTKIIMRLPERNDCEAVGNAVGANEDQIKEISKLETGVAVVMQNNWLESVLTHIAPFSNNYKKTIDSAKYNDMRILKGMVVKELMQQFIVDRKMNKQKLFNIIDDSSINEFKKKEMKCCVIPIIERLQENHSVEIFSKIMLNLIGLKSLFDNNEKLLVEKTECENITYTDESIKEWERSINEDFSKYIVLPDAYKDTIIRYLVNAKRYEQETINYHYIYQSLY